MLIVVYISHNSCPDTWQCEVQNQNGTIVLFFLSRAAFQFGIKMSEGRKTRRAGPKDEKAKLDRDWQKISQVW